MTNKSKGAAKKKATKKVAMKVAMKKVAMKRRLKTVAARKRATFRDAPTVPTAKQVEQSLSAGKSLPLTEFYKGVKL